MPHVRIWVFDEALASGVTGPTDVLTAANRLWLQKNVKQATSKPLFEWRIESITGMPVRTASGQILLVDGPIEARTHADAVIVAAPFLSDIAEFLRRLAEFRPLMTAMRRQHEKGALIATYCTGSFLLAEAGMLDGLIATTHWAKARIFKDRYPLVNLQPGEIITEQDRIICGGAVTTYLNLALRLVERLADPSLASATAKMLLIDTNRPSQSAYATLASLNGDEHPDKLVKQAQKWMERHVDRRFFLSELASHLAVSERTLVRRFKLVTGQPPLRYLQSLRIEVAKVLLETRAVRVDAVCERVGYGDLSTFRQLFKRETGLSPREYRRRFALRETTRVAGQ
jgi:transcriptional regulator GlxA family with amidase domain